MALPYSPYHHVKNGTAYPAVLLATRGIGQRRVDAMHARKMQHCCQASTSSETDPGADRSEGWSPARKPRGKILMIDR